MLKSANPMLRRSALIALEAYPIKLRFKDTFSMLEDKVKTVRIEAIRQLLALPVEKLDEIAKKKYTKALTEYKNVLLFTAERPETQLSLAKMYEIEKRHDKAKLVYKEALRLQPKYIPAYVNYANFYKNRGDEKSSKAILEQGLNILPETAILHHALGLWYIRAKDRDNANKSLLKAMNLDKKNARFAYVYAVSIGNTNPKKAIEILEKSYNNNQGNMELISGLIYYYQQVGDLEKSNYYDLKMKALQHRFGR